MRELENTIQNSRETVSDQFKQGQDRLAAMRTLVSAPGPIQPRSDRFAEEAVALAGVIAALEQTSIAPSVARAAADLSAGFIAPVADGLSADLAGRQDAVMATVRESVAAQSTALSDAAAEILAQPKVAERRYVPLSSAEAVLRYAGSFLPSWAGAISIDLLPAVLVGVLAVVFASIRRGESELTAADRITAADMMRSLELHDTIMARKAAATETTATLETGNAPQTEPETAQNITPLSTLSDRKRHEP